MFYTFDQNNSGGSFVFDAKRGIKHHVIVEAVGESEAIARAEEIGLYFGGGVDCPCCGDRWSAYTTGHAEPMVYGKPVVTYKPFGKWIKGPEVYVHYLDGRVEGFCE